MKKRQILIFIGMLLNVAGLALSDPPALKSGCQWDAWSTQYHDPARTSTSLGCISGALTPVWTYTPDSQDGGSQVFSFIAEPDAVYAIMYWGHCYNVIWGGHPQGPGQVSGLQITYDGATGWMTCPGSSDYGRNDVPSVAEASSTDGFPQSLILNSDIGELTKTGPGTINFGIGPVDVWGQTAADANRIYQVNYWDVDGPAWYVRALDHSGNQIWINNNWGNGRLSQVEPAGMAIDGSHLFFAPNYGSNPFASGVYAFDSATGASSWYQATSPVSDICAGGGRVYLLENSVPIGRSSLVARSETTGNVIWSIGPLAYYGYPPIYTGNQLINSLYQIGIQALDPATGGTLWTSTIQAFQGENSMAALKGSQTLVVIDTNTYIHVLKLSSGQEVWRSSAPITNNGYSIIASGNRLYVHSGSGITAYESLGDLASSGGGGSSSSSGPAASIVENVRVYPNPWRGNQHGGKPITFDQMNGNSTVKIFTEDAHWVKTLQAPNGSVTWDLTNDSGNKVASGLYLYLVSDGSGSSTTGKLSIIK